MATKKTEAADSAAVDLDGSEEPMPVEEPVPLEEPVVEEQVPVEEPVEEEAVVAETPAAESAPRPEYIVVDAPVQPRDKSNRGLGVALALLATIIYTALLAAVAFLFPVVNGGSLLEPTFYFPALLFFIGLVLVTLVLNRAGWWSHIIGSVVVGAIVWFGSASLVLVSGGMFSMNQSEANDAFWAALFSPILIVAALLAREVAIWTGAVLARRGRRLKVVNAEARAAYEREQAELIPTT